MKGKSHRQLVDELIEASDALVQHDEYHSGDPDDPREPLEAVFVRKRSAVLRRMRSVGGGK